jgi:hypothetical protein
MVRGMSMIIIENGKAPRIWTFLSLSVYITQIVPRFGCAVKHDGPPLGTVVQCPVSEPPVEMTALPAMAGEETGR